MTIGHIFQIVSLVPVNKARAIIGFTKRIRVYAQWVLLGYQPFGVDEYEAFETNAVKEKLRQLIPGMCNVIVFNPERFANDPSTLREPLIQFLSDNQYELISAFLIVQENSDMKCRDFFVKTWIITNPSPSAIQFPNDLVSKLEQW